MDWMVLIDLLRFVSIGILLLIPLILFKKSDRNQQIYLSSLFCLTLVSYLLVDWNFLQNSSPQLFFLAGSFSLSTVFWLFSKSLFEDDFELNWKHLLILVFVISFNYFLYFAKSGNRFLDDNLIATLFAFLSQVVSLLFVFLAVFTAFRDREIDLIEGRIHLRKLFILASTILIGLTLIVEIALRQNAAPEILNLAQKLAITVLVFYFAMQNLEFKDGFFLSKTKVVEVNYLPEPEMLERLKTLLEKEKIYRKEGLTIKTLADELDEKEYKVRRLINQHLGFRNFNDFLNQYRVQEACEILLDEKQTDLTIIELAYFLGYQSLGPFNAAFKKQTGLTPTSYRKKHLQKPSETI